MGDVARYEHTVGRYMLFGAIGAGGMATVHIGRRLGAGGFARLVAIKRLHPHLAEEREVVHAFLDEARIAARVTHPNVVSIHDVVLDGDEVLLVMEYVPGRSLAQLSTAERKEGRSVPPAVAGTIALDLLRGLQAAHDARDERGRPLGLIHRDVSPHNLLIGGDGVARVLDFGIAKALGRMQTTATGAVKGKLAYMAPERLGEQAATTTSVDIYAAAMVVWEMLAGARFVNIDQFEDLAKFAPLLRGLVEQSASADRDRVLALIDDLAPLATDMSASANHLSELINNLRDFIRPSKTGRKTSTVTDPLPVVRHAMSVCDELAVSVGATIAYDGPQTLPRVRMSGTELTQVLVNVISNGAQAVAARNAHRGRVSIVARVNGGMLELVVRDDGVGMTSDVQNRIGTPFFTTREEGTGLGIAQCQRLIGAAGGRMAFVSEAGIGTTVTIILPITT